MTTINSKSILITSAHKHITFTKKQPTLPVSLSSSHLRSDLSHARIHCPLGSIKNLRPILSAQKTGWNLQGKLRWNLGPKVCVFFSKGPKENPQKECGLLSLRAKQKKFVRFSKRLWHLFLLILRLKKSNFLWINISWAILLRQGHGQEKHGNIPNSESHLGVVTDRRERWNAFCRVDWSQRLRNHKRCKAEKFNPIGKIWDI